MPTRSVGWCRKRIQVDYGSADSVTWSFDSLGRLTSSNDGAAVGYGYDLAGNVTTITYPGSHSVSRGYDDAGRMTISTDWVAGATTFGYDDDSNLTSTAYPDAAQVDTTVVDDAGRPSSITMTAGATTLASLDYTRDDLGQLTGEDQTSLPGTDATWGYNSLEQLTDQNSTPTWDYDPGDNLTATSGAADQVFNDANQLCSAAPATGGTCAVAASGATTYSYDTRGNRVSMTPPSPAAATSYSYDQANRLTGIDTASAAYGYDADGRRRSKTVGVDTTEFTWDRSGSLPQLLTETTGAATTSYLYGPAGLAYAQINPDGTITYLHHDQIGSVRLLTDDTGSVTGAATYDPYGSISASTGILSHLGYTGQYTDAESGFVYLRARYYDPETGQFLTVDPQFQGTRSSYGYASQMPLTMVDPSGEFCLTGVSSYDSDGEEQCNGVSDVANNIYHPIRTAVTGPYAILGEVSNIGSGASCEWNSQEWVTVCYGGRTLGGATATTYGNMVVTSLSQEEFARANGGRLLAHEVKHTDQWALFGGWFVPMDVEAASRDWIFSKLTGCPQGTNNSFETWAGLSDGGVHPMMRMIKVLFLAVAIVAAASACEGTHTLTSARVGATQSTGETIVLVTFGCDDSAPTKITAKRGARTIFTAKSDRVGTGLVTVEAVDGSTAGWTSTGEIDSRIGARVSVFVEFSDGSEQVMGFIPSRTDGESIAVERGAYGGQTAATRREFVSVNRSWCRS